MNSSRPATSVKICVNESSEVFISSFALNPELVEFEENCRGHFERAPNPFASSRTALYLDL